MLGEKNSKLSVTCDCGLENKQDNKLTIKRATEKKEAVEKAVPWKTEHDCVRLSDKV